MADPSVQSIPIARIFIDPKRRFRQVDMDYAQLLAGSMEQQGLIQPIEVRPVPIPGYDVELVAGEHRLTAAKILGWTEIRALVKESSHLEAELRQIDENLVRHELNALDRATFLARRQQVYLALHPETERGKAGAAARWHASEGFSFASDAAAKMGVSPRLIQMLIARATRIPGDIQEKIKGTWIALNGAALDALARSEPSAQRKAVMLMLRPDDPVKSVKQALRMAAGVVDAVEDEHADHLARLMEAWRKAKLPARHAFLSWLVDEGEITAGQIAKSITRKGDV